VLAGAATTAVLGVLTVVLVPVLGFVTAEVVGTWVPRWAFAAPPMLSVVAGGATAGFLARTDRRTCALLGGLAGALGVRCPRRCRRPRRAAGTPPVTASERRLSRRSASAR
ncbi:hypothetical protein, partial [Halogeometricum sp. CBA1124]|uniref:hypothetical protein n=1 Tax=Halogeometricum sp. CBA1124 TaxID=2668071 RepID=UPI0018D25980